eukprot:4358211-Lingulodinium_polyedra.AAC.1
MSVYADVVNAMARKPEYVGLGWPKTPYFTVKKGVANGRPRSVELSFRNQNKLPPEIAMNNNRKNNT